MPSRSPPSVANTPRWQGDPSGPASCVGCDASPASPILIGGGVDPASFQRHNDPQPASSPSFRGFSVRTGLDVGMGVGTMLGTSRLTFEVFGPAMSTALRMARAAPRDRPMASAAFVECHERPQTQLPVISAYFFTFVACFQHLLCVHVYCGTKTKFNKNQENQMPPKHKKEVGSLRK